MVDSSVMKICGPCLLLSGVLGLGLPAFGSSIGYPIFVDFGDAATLQHFASIWPLPLWFAILAAMVPTLTLSSGLGFYYMLKDHAAIVVLGVVLLSLGLVFTVAQDGIELTLVAYLPQAYAAADPAARPALLAIGDVGATAMTVFAGSFGMVGYLGMLLINWAMLKRGGNWRLVAGIGLFSAVAIIIASTLGPLFPVAQAGFPIGFIPLRIWMIVMGVMMIRWPGARSPGPSTTDTSPVSS